ncbi:hypothetical protein LshimejAT787_1901730 [Lyophyllum shimeji]|uniref:DUF6534 domain-containing protein n=1 Tax=Lyophyllum shimeji TaxID=47721 RepID=A0A9P3PZZ9_LYOSH|nr:hypothetical protein LshimejAT787_1901730 [Lyophyllum shimeji]
MSHLPTLDSTLGAVAIGLSVSCVVFGVLSTQVFLYYRRYPADRLFYKLLVGIIWTLELVDQILIVHFVYYYTITHFGDYITLLTGKVVWSVLTEVAIAALVGILVKACYAMRVWRFSNRNIWITGIISFFILAQFALATLYVVRSFQWNRFDLTPKLRTYAAFSLAAGVATDILTASALAFFLRRLRTGFKSSNSLVNRLTVYAINTGAVTSAISLSTLLLYNLTPDAFYFIALYFLLAKFYAISLLCTLNTRKIIRGKGTDREGGSSKAEGHAHSNSFYMLDINTQTSRHMARSPPISPINGIKVGVHDDFAIKSDEQHHAERMPPPFPEPPLHSSAWRD